MTSLRKRPDVRVRTSEITGCASENERTQLSERERVRTSEADESPNENEREMCDRDLTLVHEPRDVRILRGERRAPRQKPARNVCIILVRV